MSGTQCDPCIQPYFLKVFPLQGLTNSANGKDVNLGRISLRVFVALNRCALVLGLSMTLSKYNDEDG